MSFARGAAVLGAGVVKSDSMRLIGGFCGMNGSAVVVSSIIVEISLKNGEFFVDSVTSHCVVVNKSVDNVVVADDVEVVGSVVVVVVVVDVVVVGNRKQHTPVTSNPSIFIGYSRNSSPL